MPTQSADAAKTAFRPVQNNPKTKPFFLPHSPKPKRNPPHQIQSLRTSKDQQTHATNLRIFDRMMQGGRICRPFPCPMRVCAYFLDRSRNAWIRLSPLSPRYSFFLTVSARAGLSRTRVRTRGGRESQPDADLQRRIATVFMLRLARHRPSRLQHRPRLVRLSAGERIHWRCGCPATLTHAHLRPSRLSSALRAA